MKMALITIMLLTALLLASCPCFGINIDDVEFSDFLLLGVEPNANLQISTTGDIYLWVPTGELISDSLDFRALQNIIVNCDLNALHDITFSTGSFADIDNPPTIFQDVVVRISGPVGTLNLDSAGSIVADIDSIPEPSLMFMLLFFITCLSVRRYYSNWTPLLRFLSTARLRTWRTLF